MTEAFLVSMNPATGEAVGRAPVTPPDALDALARRARAAARGWRALPAAERVERLSRAKGVLEGRAEALGRLITDEMGRPLKDALNEVRGTAASIPGLLRSVAAALAPESLEDGRVRSTLVYEPLGVVACISPWNFPVNLPHQQVFPALAAGNAVIFKPSEETPLVGRAYAEALAEVLPPDVLQWAIGGAEQGRRLVEADVDLVLFTGSRDAGQDVLRRAAGGFKRAVLELGGKTPLLILEGADVARAAELAARSCFWNSGQACISVDRILVHESLHRPFRDELVRRARALRVGPGTEPGVDLGPMIHDRQRRKVLDQVRDAVERGAERAFEGEHPGGNFLGPIVLDGVTPAMAIAREETFGPVACLTAVGSEDDAVAQANDSSYALGAVVFGPPERAREVARRLDAAMVGVNHPIRHAPGAPWVGAKRSGYGFQGGREGHRQLAQVRVLSESTGD